MHLTWLSEAHRTLIHAVGLVVRQVADRRGLMYVDPGYGALILQSIIAGAVGTVYIAKRKVALWFKAFLNPGP